MIVQSHHKLVRVSGIDMRWLFCEIYRETKTRARHQQQFLVSDSFYQIMERFRSSKFTAIPNFSFFKYDS